MPSTFFCQTQFVPQQTAPVLSDFYYQGFYAPDVFGYHRNIEFRLKLWLQNGLHLLCHLPKPISIGQREFQLPIPARKSTLLSFTF